VPKFSGFAPRIGELEGIDGTENNAGTPEITGLVYKWVAVSGHPESLHSSTTEFFWLIEKSRLSRETCDQIPRDCHAISTCVAVKMAEATVLGSAN